MERFTSAVERALRDANWYWALMIALTLPDICGWLEDPSLGSKARNVAWSRRFLEPRYTYRFGKTHRHTFLSADDTYALRCAVLHEGSDDITRQRARAALERFHFIDPPPPPRVVHCNQVNDTLELQVDMFCQDILAGVRQWADTVLASSAAARARLDELIVIHSAAGNISVP